MEKLQLKHLASYLPYGLRWKIKNELFYTGYMSTKRIALISPNHNGELCKYLWNNLPKNIKPILRPLSDLTKEIEIDREKFVPIEIFDFGDDNSNNKIPDYGLKNYDYLLAVSEHNLTYDINFLPFGVVEFLFKWHFDVFGLIEKGLAISYNDIK